MTDATRPTDDEVRAAFETWAMNAVPLPSRAGYYGTGGTWVYRHNIMQLMWQCWRAASTTSPQPHIAAEPGEVERTFIAGWNQAAITLAPGSGFHPNERAEAWAEHQMADARKRLTAAEPRAAGEGIEAVLRGVNVARDRLAPLMKNGEDNIWRPAQFAYEVLGNAEVALRQPSTERESVRKEAFDRYRHKARGTEYDLIGTAELQDAKGDGVEEGALLAIYRGDDGKLWARRHSEFGDGRFERLPAIRALKASSKGGDHG